MQKLSKFAFSALPWVIIACWLVWFLGVLSHGLGANIWGSHQPNFEAAGQFGDSFGPVASLMAALAASGVFLTLAQQRKENANQRAEAEENHVRSRIQDFESTFFRLLDVLINKTDRIDLIVNSPGLGLVTVRGSDAFAQYKKRVEDSIMEFDADEQVGNYYLDEFKIRESDLGHYFRLVYHLILLADSSKNLDLDEARYKYARMVRAQLSNPELFIIMMNCLYGQGQERFLPLAIKYDLFQHLGESEDPLSHRMFNAFENRVQQLGHT